MRWKDRESSTAPVLNPGHLKGIFCGKKIVYALIFLNSWNIFLMCKNLPLEGLGESRSVEAQDEE